jgi:hypothetical protein
VLKSPGPEDKNASLGRAIARVSAHEIYHMLTGSERHARRGIARSSHSRAELTAPRFGFAQKETDWLRAWAIKPAGQAAVAAVEVGGDTVKTDSTESESVSSAGR